MRGERRLRVSENRVLGRIFDRKSDQVIEVWTRHNEECNDMYPSQNIIRVMKSRIMRWAGHVACMGERSVYSVLVGKREGKSHLEDRGLDGRIVLQCIFKTWGGGM